MTASVTTATWWRERLAGAWAKRELRWLAVILALATAVRLAWVIYAAREPQELHDPFFYVFYAAQIANGDGYRLLDGQPTAYYPIGYPATLAGVYALLKHTLLPEEYVKAYAALNLVLGVATVGLVYAVGRRLFDATVGLVAAFLLAVFPNIVFHTATPLTETLFNFVVMLALLVLIGPDWRERRLSPWRVVVFGLLLGYSVLIRPVSLPFLGLLLIVMLAWGFGCRRALQYTAVATVATVAVIVPWTVRNAIVMDAFVPISTNTGDNLCMGHHAGAPGHFVLPDVCFAGFEDLERPEFELRREARNRDVAVEFAREHPVTEVKLFLKKARWTWDHDHDGLDAVESYNDDRFMDRDLRAVLLHIADGYFFIVMAIGGVGLAGLVWPWWEPRRVFFLLALLWLAGVPLFFFGDARFHIPTVPLVCVTAAWAIVMGVRTLAGRSAASTVVVELPDAKAPVPDQDALQDT